MSYVYDDKIIESLTPNKLIFGKNLVTCHADLSDISNSNMYVNFNECCSTLIKNLDTFWSLWRREYLTNLRETHQKRLKKRINSIDPNIDDVVLIHDEKLKLSSWKMGRIKNLLKSSDGKYRSAENVIAAANRKNFTITRSLNKLYPIESSMDK